MENKQIGHVLKYYRKAKNLTVSKVSEYLSEKNFPAAPKTIYGWENGHSQPNTETLLLLCNLYEIEDILYAFGYGKVPSADPVHLTSHEEELIRQYRKHPELQSAIDKILDIN